MSNCLWLAHTAQHEAQMHTGHVLLRTSVRLYLRAPFGNTHIRKCRPMMRWCCECECVLILVCAVVCQTSFDSFHPPVLILSILAYRESENTGYNNTDL